MFALFVVSCSLLAAGPASALAGTVTNGGGGPAFTGDAGQANSLTVTANATTVVFTDANNNITTAASGCTGNGTATVTCTGTFGFFNVDAGDQNDSVTVNGPLGGSVDGGPGNDVIVGSNENTSDESLDGEAGTDQINSRNVGAPVAPSTSPVSDFASGGSENDVVVTGNGNDDANGGTGTDAVGTGTGNDSGDGGPGDGDQVDLGAGDDSTSIEGVDDGVGDTLQGGPGFDSVSTSSSTFGPIGTVLDAFSANLATGAFAKTNNTPESDTVAGFEDYFANNDTGANTVLGTPGSNMIDTDEGVDLVNPGAGADQLSLRGGNDSADTRDGSGDRVQCGNGVDTLAADQFDEASDCESVSISKVRPAGADVIAPKCKIAKVKGRYTRTSFFKGVTARVTCSEAATLTVQEYVGVKRSGKLVTTAKTGDLILAEKTVKLGKLVNTVKLKASKKLGKKLPKRFKAKIRITAQDEFGNRSTVTKRTAVKTKAKKKSKKKK